MSDAVIVALITVGANLIVSLASAAIQSKSVMERLKAESELSDAKLDAKFDKFAAVQNEKIDELSRRVEKHNQVVERTYKLETDVARHEERIKTLFNTER